MARGKRAWIDEHRRDPFVKAAQRGGYRSRASFKLIQIDDRERFLRPGTRVLDLGAAPGGWSQVAAERVGASGRVVAVDLAAMAPIAGVEILRGDVLDEAVRAEIGRRLGARGADLVLSDMAPDLTGIRDTDQANALAVAQCALDLARAVLRPGGSLLVKLFEGPDAAAFRRAIAGCFARTAVLKPQASRARSAEHYLLAREWREV